jgi:O-antigen/teichoic acid export membrane protein
MVAGTGSIIIGTSKNYRMQTVFQFILVSLLIITNWLFIPLLGITGAAIATLISKIIVNLIRYIYIFKKYKLQPYNYKFLIVLLIAIISLFMSKFLPEFSNYIIDIIVRSSIMSGLFFLLILFFKVSGEINDQFNSSIRSITNKLKR